LLILVFNSMVFAQGVSLGDAARQERARQKNSTGNLKVTNETLGTAEGPPSSAEPAKTDADAAKAAAAKVDDKTDSTTEGPHDEASWREAFSHARDAVKRAEDHVQNVQVELNKLNLDLLTRSDIFNREGQLAPLIDAKNKELADAEKDLTDARDNVSQLETDLRKAGAPSGWAR
jgi:chromosome segregation ATPase